MSHATVTVRITDIDTLDRAAIEERLAAMMAPYYEQGDDDSPYMQFNDCENTYVNEYENEGCTMVKIDRGSEFEEALRQHRLDKLSGASEKRRGYDRERFATAIEVGGIDYLHRWDEVFRVPGTFGTGGGSHVVPEGLTQCEVPHKARFASLEEFAKEWHGAERDEKHNRYGHYSNPNAKWDWYVIGGRWTGFYPFKASAEEFGSALAFRDELWSRRGESGTGGNKPNEGKVDIVRVSDIDFDKVATEHRERFEKFCTEYVQLLAGHKFPSFEGPRSRALDVGLIRVERGPYPSPVGDEIVMSWADAYGSTDDRAAWHDVALPLTEERKRQIWNAFNPLKTFAALDADGWHEPGEMGWFGCSSDTPETYLAYADSFSADLSPRSCNRRSSPRCARSCARTPTSGTRSRMRCCARSGTSR
jgi:hypothetical protein